VLECIELFYGFIGLIVQEALITAVQDLPFKDIYLQATTITRTALRVICYSLKILLRIYIDKDT
jgi:hypothetical protein